MQYENRVDRLSKLINEYTWGWTIISWNEKGGCLAQWFPTLKQAYDQAEEWEKRYDYNMLPNETKTTKIELLRRQYKDRMDI